MKTHLKQVHVLRTFLMVAILSLSFRSFAEETITLTPYKNELFQYRAVIHSEWDGQFREVPFDKQVDEYGRDQEGQVLKKVKAEYVSTELTISQQRKRVLNHLSDGKKLETFEVGQPEDARFAVIFVHGGTREQGNLGMEDWRFGGNFNRLKNIVLQNKGVYYSPTVSLSFTDEDAAHLGALIDVIKKASPSARIIMACASSGGAMCNKLAHFKDAGSRLAGLIYMGSPLASDLHLSAAAKAKLPVYIAHGAEDKNIVHSSQFSKFSQLRKDNYPTLYVLFQNGAHGTPIRMLDWYEALNWIFSSQSL